MFNDGGCLLVIDQQCRFQDEFFRIVLKLVKDRWFDSLEDCYDSLSRKAGLIHQFTNQVIFHIGTYGYVYESGVSLP